MTEKMTDGELKRAQEVADYFNPDGKNLEQRLLAHIAALATERDEARRRLSECHGLLGDLRGENGILSNERDALREHLDKTKAERDAMEQERDEASALVTENAQLRDRVNELMKTRAEVDRLRLSVQRSEEEKLRNAEAVSAWHAEFRVVASRLAAMRQRAETWRCKEEWALLASILGDDAPALFETDEPPQTDDLSAIERHREDEEAADALQRERDRGGFEETKALAHARFTQSSQKEEP